MSALGETYRRHKNVPMNYKLNKQNLTPFNSETGRIAGSRPKKPSKKKALAGKIAWLKKKGLTDENSKKMYEFLTDPELGAADIYLYLEAIKSATGKDPDGMIKIVNAALNLHKQVHGQKVHTENLNINVETNMKEFGDKMRDIMGDTCD